MTKVLKGNTAEEGNSRNVVVCNRSYQFVKV